MKITKEQKAKNFIISLNCHKQHYIDLFNQSNELRFNVHPRSEEYFVALDFHGDIMEIIKLIQNDCDFINYNYHFKDIRTPYTNYRGNLFGELVSLKILITNINMKSLNIKDQNNIRDLLKNYDIEIRFTLRSVPINIVYDHCEVKDDEQNYIKVKNKDEAIQLIHKFLDKLKVVSNEKHHLKDERSSTSKEGYLFAQIVKVKPL